MPDPFSRKARVAFFDIETSGLQYGPRGQLLQYAAQVVDPDDTAKVVEGGSLNIHFRPTPDAFFREGTDIEKLRSQGLLSSWSKLGAKKQRQLQPHLHATAQENLMLDDKDLGFFYPAPGATHSLRSPEEGKDLIHAFLEKHEVDYSIGHNASKFDAPFLENYGINTRFKTDSLSTLRDKLNLRSGEGNLENLGHISGELIGNEAHEALSDTDLLRRIWTKANTKEGNEAIRAGLNSFRNGETTALQKLGNELPKAAPNLGHIFKQIKGNMSKFATNSIEFGRKNPVLAVAAGVTAAWGLAALAAPIWRIPSSDDAYNTITGMDEGGTAAQFRKLRTDFGSGYRGPVGSIKVHGQTIDSTVQGFRAKWYGDFSDPSTEQELKAKIKASGETYDRFRPDELEAGPQEGTVAVNLHKFNTRWDDADTLLLRRKGVIQAMFAEDIAIRLVGIDSPETTHPHDPTEWFRFRQQQPFGAEATEIAKQIAPHPDKLVMDPSAITYGRYVGLLYSEGEKTSVNQRLVEEGAAAHLPFGEAGSDIYSRKAFQASEDEASSNSRGLWADPFYQTYKDVAKGMGGRITFNTLTDLSRLSKNYSLAAAQSAMWSAHETGEYNPQAGLSLGRKLRPSMGRFFGKKPKLSAKDDDHNTIEAMGHSGIAHIARKRDTDFGSGFDGLKALFRGAERLESITAKEGIKDAFKSGRVIKQLGEGGYGVVHLMETEIEGKTLQYARKTLHPVGSEQYNVLGEKGIKNAKLSLKNEHHALKLMHEGPMTPSPYLHDTEAHALYMEYMPGETLLSMAHKGEAAHLTDEGSATLVSEIHRAASLGITNPDIAKRNLMYDKVSGRTSWIDFGLTEKYAGFHDIDKSLEASRSVLSAEQQIRHGIVKIDVDIPGSGYQELFTPSTPKKQIKKLQMSARQKDANIANSFSAEFGGKGHSTHSNKSK